MKLKSRKSGISLISLIITIIVIIILAAIVIFSGMDTPEKAQLSKVISDIDNVQTAVDQAYYGLYTEKAVAGEVWTQSQFYEAVATGKTNREDLTATGLVEIAEDSLVDINLPVYEGRKWYIAVSDVSDTVKTGSAVLSPGFESQGKTYATLLDIQNGGSDEASSNGNINEPTLTDTLQVGDYIEYSGDINNSYTLNPDLTGYTDTTTLKPSTSVSWRVWKIEGDKVIIMPTLPVNSFYLKGSTGFVNSVDIINNVCKMYANETYGVSAGDIRSLTIEDLEEVSTDLTDTRDDYQKDSSNYPKYGETNVYYYGTKKGNSSYKGYTSGTFYTAKDGKTIIKEGITASSEDGKQVEITQTHYNASNPTWKSLENSNFPSDTYGNLLGYSTSWLASPCVRLASSSAYFYVRCAYSGSVSVYNLCYANGYSISRSSGVRPLVTLSSSQIKLTGTGDGTSGSPYEIIKK